MGIALLLASVTACGGGTPPPPSPGDARRVSARPVPPRPSPPPPPAAAPVAPAAAPAAPPAAEASSDPNEKPDGFVHCAALRQEEVEGLVPQEDGDTTPSCWATVGVTGDHTKDYAAIVAACGAPTGLAEYVQPVEGKLHHRHDPRDIYKMPARRLLLPLLCGCRLGIADLDLLIEKPGGALVGDDKTNSPIAIIEATSRGAGRDQTLEFHVKVDGPGSGVTCSAPGPRRSAEPIAGASRRAR